MFDCIVTDSNGYKLPHLVQWDTKVDIIVVIKPIEQFLELDGSVEVHFYNSKSKTATAVSAQFDGKNKIPVTIPDSFLEEGLDIGLYVYQTKSGSSRTIAQATIPVIKRIEKGG